MLASVASTETDTPLNDSLFYVMAPSPPIVPPQTNNYPDLQFENSPMFDMSITPEMREIPTLRFEPDHVTRSLSSLFETTNVASPNPATRPSSSGLTGDVLAKSKCLCNVLVYLVVIARLTSVDEDDLFSFDYFMAPSNTPSPLFSGIIEIDLLTSRASSLFPLVGRVANLCHRVRKVKSNSIAIISEAIELKEAIFLWSPSLFATIERPEDPTSEIQHALQIAEAYRYATLLYLHQAVPEIPSWTSAQLAKKVLVYLATVPLSSRLVFVQIYPLLAAGCEVHEKEDRQWVEERWQAMASCMWFGDIECCLEVTQEVWDRRDVAEAARTTTDKEDQQPGVAATILFSETSKRKSREELRMDDVLSYEDLMNGSSSKKQRTNFSGTISPPVERKIVHESVEEEINEVTVRDRLHWIGVMKDWDRELSFLFCRFAFLP